MRRPASVRVVGNHPPGGEDSTKNNLILGLRHGAIDLHRYLDLDLRLAIELATKLAYLGTVGTRSKEMIIEYICCSIQGCHSIKDLSFESPHT